MPVTHYVASSGALLQTLKTIQTGDTIALAQGDYGMLTLKGQAGFDMAFAGGVTITSADPAARASFGGLDLRGAANITFDGIDFDYDFAPGDVSWTRPFQVIDSANITFTDTVFDGDVATGVSDVLDGFGNGYALSVTGSSGLTVSDSTFTGFTRGMIITESQSVVLTGNDITDMRSDGINLTAVTDVQIMNNYIHDFRAAPGAGDHPDFIQIWTRGTTTPSTGITISGNFLDIGNGTPAQSIFIRNDLVDRGLAGEEMFFRDITITDNVVVNAQTHGITVGETDGLVISNNTVVHADGAAQDGADASVEIPRIHVSAAARNVEIAHNITASISGAEGQGDWLVTGNVLVQDQNPAAAGYYGDLFLASSLDQDGVHQFLAIPDGLLAQTGAGASATYASFSGETGTMLTAQFQVTPDETNAALRVFDASASGNDAGVTYTWNFGDGSTAQGAVVSHSYLGGGTYDVTLTVSDATGASTLASSTVGVAGPQVLSLQQDGRFEAYDMGTAILLDGMGQGDSGGLYLGEPGVTTSVARVHVADVLDTGSFAIDMTLQAHTTASVGEVFRLHSSFLANVDTAGEMTLYAWPDEGSFIKLKTSGAGLNDTASHDVTISLSDGVLSLGVDGAAVSAAMIGTLANLGRHDLVFGNPWGKANFASTVTSFDITVDAEDYPASGVLGAADSFDFINGGDIGEIPMILDASPTPEPAFGTILGAFPGDPLLTTSLIPQDDDFGF